jgi:hypothetical protein
MKLLNEQSSRLFEGKPFPSESLFSVENSNVNRYEAGNSDQDREGDKPVLSEVVPAPLYKTCAVIPNSAAFDGAKHGIDIGKRKKVYILHLSTHGLSNKSLN